MKSRKWLLAAGLALLVCFAEGCGLKVKGPQDGRLKDGVYTNRFFAFQVRIPDTWTVLKKPTRSTVRKGAEAVSGDKEFAAAVASEAAKRVHYLVLARNVVVGMHVAITAESVKHVPEVKTGRDYLDQALELFSGADKPLQQVQEVVPVKLAGREFYRTDLAGSLMGMNHHQAMFVTVEKGFALLILVGAKNAEAVEEAMGLLGLAVSELELTQVPAGKGVATVKARAPAKPLGPDPVWVKEIKLQGVSGPEGRRLAIINGKTFAVGDAESVKVGKKYVTVKCVAIDQSMAKVTMDGIDGERELRLGW